MNAARNLIFGDPDPRRKKNARSNAKTSGRRKKGTRTESSTSVSALDFSATPLLAGIDSPADLRALSPDQLRALATEIRLVLRRLSEQRSVHFASNLGVVELAIALHATFDFSKDRLLWDTGHQCYPHKLLTGRFGQFETIRTFGGLMGYPNPDESPFDLFMTGHAGTSVGSALGLTVGDLLTRPEENRHSIAVVGDGALASGVGFESLNHAGGLRKNLTVILNDNKMSICGRVGGLGRYLDRLRMARAYLGFKTGVHRVLDAMPTFGSTVHRFLSGARDAVKAGLLGGMLFEEFGFRYIGPIDGHDIELLRRYLRMVRDYREPVLLHILTEKGRGFRPAELDPASYHAPKPELVGYYASETKEAKTGKKNAVPSDEMTPPEELPDPAVLLPHDDDPDMVGTHSYTHWARNAIFRLMRDDPRVCVITAAMTQGNMLQPLRKLYPDRFFDVGICESHAVVFAAGLARSGMIPLVDIYSTFLQRAYDHLFQEVSLQDLPVVFLIDRAGLVGADGPTHHGVFDLAYLRPFPNFALFAPGDSRDMEPMLRLAVERKHPTAIRYPREIASRFDRTVSMEFGRAEVLREGKDGFIAALGEEVATALNVSRRLAALPRGNRIEVGVINARFVKPLDVETILAPLRAGKFLVTAEEGVLAGGFGSAVLEAANEERLDTRRLVRLGIGDRFVPHGSRSQLLKLVGLDEDGLTAAIQNIR